MARSVAIIGGGIAGLAAAYELQRMREAGADVSFTLFEQSNRLGGIVETHRQDGFVIECGPDGWVTDKPWARELAEELGLGDEVIPSQDEARVTWVLRDGKLVAMPDGMRMMVPERLDAVMQSPLFSETARAAYAAEPGRADELKASAPDHDESVASFVRRHFGEEVLRVVGAPLLGGVFGGDVEKLSVRSVMAPFVAMEREHGSLTLALQARAAERGGRRAATVFTSLRSGTATLIDRMVAAISPDAIWIGRGIVSMERTSVGWQLQDTLGAEKTYDHVMLAAPVHVAASLLEPVNAEAAALLNIPSSSAVIAGFGYAADAAPKLPAGFGFLSPDGEDCQLLAGTFADQKFDGRVPPSGKSVRAYFGGARADALIPCSDEEIAATAKHELKKVLGPLPEAAVTIVRRWPDALPQYEVGHGDRMAQLQQYVDAIGALHLLGNGYRGVGLPDLVRDGRAAARSLIA
ncbi:protoporphyrinogen oxidase [Terriglobus roseus]|uniref:Coproporphyrinogen III oxidase n=1 Tax=Terriglobus roseus TaxID=392734 RepID=A0A1H4M865_9BACT|nr:protoporphyrinogen oxidase [Terriglobus roseus]SEB78954.1 oxygen-dependent protoporphyrinogen oxidase [Terriglobus roseus]